MKKLIFVLLISSSACATGTKYNPKQLADAELLWQFDSGLEVHRGGEKVAGQMTWSGLSDAVACVDAARDEASGAHTKALVGKTLVFTGTAVTLAGSGVMIASLFPSEGLDTDLLVTGSAVLTGGLVAMLTGLLFDLGATPDAIDAVNLYNDAYATTDGCVQPDGL